MHLYFENLQATSIATVLKLMHTLYWVLNHGRNAHLGVSRQTGIMGRPTTSLLGVFKNEVVFHILAFFQPISLLTVR